MTHAIAIIGGGMIILGWWLLVTNSSNNHIEAASIREANTELRKSNEHLRGVLADIEKSKQHTPGGITGAFPTARMLLDSSLALRVYAAEETDDTLTICAKNKDGKETCMEVEK
jgi:NAD(P)H-dependent flavin oxidoreductase YrpB (nitropropane dioxygenase family)